MIKKDLEVNVETKIDSGKTEMPAEKVSFAKNGQWNLEKAVDFGFSDNGKVATSPAQAAPSPVAPAPKPKYTMADLQAAKAKLKTK